MITIKAWTVTRRVVVALAAAVILLVIFAGPAGAHSYDQPDRVLVGTTGNDSELVTTLPIGAGPGQGQQVVMSLPCPAPSSCDPPDNLPSLISGDRLKLSSELEVTTDCINPNPDECIGRRSDGSPASYTYNPIVDSQLILASDGAATGGPGTTPISDIQTRTCRQQPDRQHHCVLVFDDPFLDVSAPAPACAATNACHVNLVVSAHNPAALPGDKLIIGQDNPGGTIGQDQGRLNAVRLRPIVPGAELAGRVNTFLSTTPVVNGVPVGDDSDNKSTVVFSQQLNELQSEEQLAVSADMTTDISQLPYKALVNSKLILTSGPAETSESDPAETVTKLDQIAEANGFNCTETDTPCLTKKVGVASLIADANKPLFVNLVVRTRAVGGATAQPGDAVDVTGGRLQVVRYPPPVTLPPPSGKPPPSGEQPPSNEFSFGKVKKNKRKGTAKLTVEVPGPGELELAKTKKVKADEEPVEAAGNEKLRVKAKGKASKNLSAKGKAKVKAKVTYTPTGGSPNTESKKIKLVQR